MTAITVVSSRERCGIQTYSHALVAAFRELGHDAEYAGVTPWRTRELFDTVRRIPRGTRVVIFEHEFGVFHSKDLALAMAWLRLRGKTVLLSVHELEPDKFGLYHRIVEALHFHQRWRSPLVELARIFWATVQIGQRMIRYRFPLWLLGLFPSKIVFHSGLALSYSWLMTSSPERTEVIPHFVEPLAGAEDPLATDREGQQRRLRAKLGLPQDRFIFVSPGFLFRRKRLIEVIAATPPDATLVLAGTEGKWDAGYLDEIRRYVADYGFRNVVIDTDYDRMPEHFLAADAVVLFYEKTFQSGIASHAMWAGLPCIVTDDPGFAIYDGAALRVADEDELRRAMREIRRPEVIARLRARAVELRDELSPRRMAERYLRAAGA